MIKRFLHALQFLTVFTLSKDLAPGPGGLASSIVYFPLVGALQGIILVIAWSILGGFLPWAVVTALLLIILAITNGGLHLDGFIDTVDGLAGGKNPKERLEIMRDSGAGALGVAFLVLVLILKFAALNEVPAETRGAVIFLFPVMGRWAIVPMACWSGYARKTGGLGEAFTGIGSGNLIAATGITAILSIIFIGIISLLHLIFLGALVYIVTSFFRRKLGGVTGDVFGFQSEVAEVFFLLLVLAL